MIEDLLEYHDPELLQHFVSCGVTSQLYAWIPFQNLFTEILSKDEWTLTWDHCLTNDPGFLYYFLVAYLKFCRVSLMSIKKLEDFKFFLRRENPINIRRIIKSAYQIARNTPSKLSPGSILCPFQPLLEGAYPVFNQYPSFVVNYRTEMRERIRREEEEYMHKRTMMNELTKLSEDLRRDRRAWEAADWKMNEVVDKWWDTMMSEEESHAQRKARLDAMEKEQRAKAMRQIAEARKSFVDHHMASTARHLSLLSKAVGENRRRLDEEVESAGLEERFKDLEDEWSRRREELLQAREEMVKRDRERVERITWNARKIKVTIPSG
ncbi:TBC1 domain member 31 [Quaeritorhiza haematococci]|nr:TBC1 domain member 31 [Quaeritorhiza haematococci]